MKRLIYALLFAAATAMDETPTEENPTDESPTSDKEYAYNSGLKGWFISDQTPVTFDSITTKDPYTLSGKYGWYKRSGMDFVFISQTLDGATIADDALVLTWIQFPDPEEPGNIEGFYCTVKYNSADKTGKNVDVETFEGTAVDFANQTGSPDEWCPPPEEGVEDTSGCKRHSVSSWQEFFTFENYPSSWDDETQVSSQACSSWRKTNTPDAFVEIKIGTTYSMSTGYKTYTNASNYAVGTVAEWGTGTVIEMTF